MLEWGTLVLTLVKAVNPNPCHYLVVYHVLLSQCDHYKSNGRKEQRLLRSKGGSGTYLCPHFHLRLPITFGI